MRAGGRGGRAVKLVSIRFWLPIGLLFRDRGVPEELTSALRTDERRASPRFRRWEPVDNDVFHPVAMVTRMAAVVVPVRRCVPRDLRQPFLQPGRVTRIRFVHQEARPGRVALLSAGRISDDISIPNSSVWHNADRAKARDQMCPEKVGRTVDGEARGNRGGRS